MGDQCRWPPPGGTPIAPSSTQVITHPVVGDLDGDGRAEIVFISFADVRDPDFGINGILRIINGADCADVTTTVDVGCVTCFGESVCHSLDESPGAGSLCSTCGFAIADLDRDGFMEIIGISEGDLGDPDAHRRLLIFDHLGQFKACSPAPPEPMGYLTHPAVADLDGDGVPEIVGHADAFEPDGSIRFSSERVAVGLTTIADVDGDGSADVVLGERVLRADGSILWDRPDLFPATPAVGDLDGDCLPEIVLVTWHQARVTVVDGATGATRATTQLPGGLSTCLLPRPGQGGPPALADVDGDCLPEIGVAGCEAYSLYRFNAGAGSLDLVWQRPTQDRSSRTTASTFFDLDADGTPEILYNDELTLWRFNGATGNVVESLPNTTFTLVEYPTVADVDSDGATEVVIASNNIVFCCDTGLRVLADDALPWAAARSLQNQHSYHVTNIADDGTIPLVEEPSWSRGNDFRSQRTPNSCEAPCSFIPSCSVSIAPAACAGPRTSVAVMGSIEAEDIAGAIAHAWSTTCPGGIFDDPSSLTPNLELDGPPPCPRT